jgi:formiminoglutamase
MKLPLLLTVPHGGTKPPPEARECLLSSLEIAVDGDTWSRELYALEDSVTQLIDTEIPRAIVDLNRSPEDTGRADGVVKEVTVDGTQVWKSSKGPQENLAQTLIDKYHRPWHQKVHRASMSEGVICGIDCHTMLGVGAIGHALQGEPRPLICISNGGDLEGGPKGERLTAPQELTTALLPRLVLCHGCRLRSRERFTCLVGMGPLRGRGIYVALPTFAPRFSGRCLRHLANNWGFSGYAKPKVAKHPKQASPSANTV